MWFTKKDRTKKL
jgi:hypothetical protein